MNTDTKLFLGIGVITIIMIAVASIFFTRPKQPVKLSGTTVDKHILIREDSHTQSTSSAKLTLVEFADFQCPSCGTAHPMIKKLLSDYPGKLNYIFRHFPLPQHDNGVVAAIASEAASEQGKFWEMHGALFENQSEWSDEANPNKLFEGYAKELGLDVGKFKKAVADKSHKDKIDRDTADGKSLGVNSTPTFFLNGERMNSFSDIEAIVKSEAKK